MKCLLEEKTIPHLEQAKRRLYFRFKISNYSALMFYRNACYFPCTIVEGYV